jgi:hypothetical protein
MVSVEPLHPGLPWRPCSVDHGGAATATHVVTYERGEIHMCAEHAAQVTILPVRPWLRLIEGGK